MFDQLRVGGPDESWSLLLQEIRNSVPAGGSKTDLKEASLNFTHRIVIGDWSGAGHGRSEVFAFRATHDNAAIVSAYKAATDAMGLGLDNTRTNRFTLLSSLDNNLLEQEDITELIQAGVDLNKLEGKKNDDGTIACTPQDAAVLFLELARTKLEGLAYEFFEEQIPINRQPGFVTHIGYGCF
jgi:hypothetical protein